MDGILAKACSLRGAMVSLVVVRGIALIHPRASALGLLVPAALAMITSASTRREQQMPVPFLAVLLSVRGDLDIVDG